MIILEKYSGGSFALGWEALWWLVGTPCNRGASNNLLPSSCHNRADNANLQHLHGKRRKTQVSRWVCVGICQTFNWVVSTMKHRHSRNAMSPFSLLWQFLFPWQFQLPWQFLPRHVGHLISHLVHLHVHHPHHHISSPKVSSTRNTFWRKKLFAHLVRKRHSR